MTTSEGRPMPKLLHHILVVITLDLYQACKMKHYNSLGEMSRESHPAWPRDVRKWGTYCFLRTTRSSNKYLHCTNSSNLCNFRANGQSFYKKCIVTEFSNFYISKYEHDRVNMICVYKWWKIQLPLKTWDYRTDRKNRFIKVLHVWLSHMSPMCHCKTKGGDKGWYARNTTSTSAKRKDVLMDSPRFTCAGCNIGAMARM